MPNIEVRGHLSQSCPDTNNEPTALPGQLRRPAKMLATSISSRIFSGYH